MMAKPQERALRKHNAMIVDTLSAGGTGTIINFAGKLLAEELITAPVHDDAIIEANPRQGASKIMMAVMGKVRNFPDKYGPFLTALRNSEMSEIADILERECCELMR